MDGWMANIIMAFSTIRYVIYIYIYILIKVVLKSFLGAFAKL
jgi:hypothetical protein